MAEASRSEGAAGQPSGAARRRRGAPSRRTRSCRSWRYAATDGSRVDLSGARGPHGRLRLSAHRPARTGLPDGWDAIPGARGCTPQSCSFRDHFAELRRLGVAQLLWLSTQDTAYQREAVERLHLPFPILSDDALVLTRALEPADLHRRRHDVSSGWPG